MQPYRQLMVWTKAHALAADVRRGLRECRAYDLADQLRRAVTSIAANIVEGAGSQSRPQFARFLGIALASAHETGYLLLLGRDTGELSPALVDDWAPRCEEIQRMLTGLIRSLYKKGRATKPAAPPSTND